MPEIHPQILITVNNLQLLKGIYTHMRTLEAQEDSNKRTSLTPEYQAAKQATAEFRGVAELFNQALREGPFVILKKDILKPQADLILPITYNPRGIQIRADVGGILVSGLVLAQYRENAMNMYLLGAPIGFQFEKNNSFENLIPPRSSR